MKKSSNVKVGMVLAVGMMFAATGCASEPDQEFMDTQADHQQLCVKISDDGNEVTRVSDDQCPSDEDNNGQSVFYVGYPYWFYMGRAFGTPPAVGSTVPRTHGSFSRPAGGTIAKPPATGGFGMARVPVAG